MSQQPRGFLMANFGSFFFWANYGISYPHPVNDTVKAPFSVNKFQISRIHFTRTDHLKV